MKRLLAVLGVVALAGMVLASAANAGDKKQHEVTVTVVSMDATAKTITFKDDKGMDKTAPVLEGAVASLKSLKPGDKVVLVCEDNDKGEHQGISAIKPAKM
jgi:hypothetical protein